MNSLADPRVVTDKTPRAIEHLGSRRLRARKGRAAGQTTVEFALICLPFFAILFAIIDYAQIYFYENSLQNAMREAARFATAGRIIQAYNSNGSPLYDTNQGVALPRAINDTVGREASRNECIRYWFQSNCVINIPISNIVVVSAPTLPGVNPTVSTNLANGDLSLLQANGSPPIVGPGNANDYIQVSATYTIQTITPLFGYLGGYNRSGWNTYRCYVTSIVKNEPALLNFLHTNIYPGEP